jgi:hypothetical protein
MAKAISPTRQAINLKKMIANAVEDAVIEALEDQIGDDEPWMEVTRPNDTKAFHNSTLIINGGKYAGAYTITLTISPTQDD